LGPLRVRNAGPAPTLEKRGAGSQPRPYCNLASLAKPGNIGNIENSVNLGHIATLGIVGGLANMANRHGTLITSLALIIFVLFIAPIKRALKFRDSKYRKSPKRAKISKSAQYLGNAQDGLGAPMRSQSRALENPANPEKPRSRCN
jgi:hypothetical protein